MGYSSHRSAILIYISYLLTQSFNVDSKLKSADDEYKFEKKVNLDTPSESGHEEDFDEIKVNKHTLCDVFVCSSVNHI